jgi:hypothetical protein
MYCLLARVPFVYFSPNSVNNGSSFCLNSVNCGVKWSSCLYWTNRFIFIVSRVVLPSLLMITNFVLDFKRELSRGREGKWQIFRIFSSFNQLCMCLKLYVHECILVAFVQHVFTCICTYIPSYIHTNIYIYIYICVYIHVCMYVCMYTDLNLMGCYAMLTGK